MPTLAYLLESGRAQELMGDISASQAASSLPRARAGMYVWWSLQRAVKGTDRGGKLGWNPAVPDTKAWVLDACLLIPLFVCHVIFGRTLHRPFACHMGDKPLPCQSPILNTGNIATGEIDQGFQFYAQMQAGASASSKL